MSSLVIIYDEASRVIRARECVLGSPALFKDSILLVGSLRRTGSYGFQMALHLATFGAFYFSPI